MAFTDEQRREDEAAYAAAFDEDMSAPTAQEDTSGGISLPADASSAEGDSTTPGDEGETVAVVLADTDDLKQAGEQEVADATTTNAEEELEQPTDPKEIQRMKSWEGRMRAREEELARREAALKERDSGKPAAESLEPGEGAESEAIEKAAESLSAQGDEQGAERVEEVADQVESGELTAEAAMKILAEDFGPEFVKMIEAIASSKAEAAGRKIAEQATSALGASVQEIIDSIVDDKARAHFETIADKHPDFNDVAQTPEFAEFTKAYPGGEEIASNGSAKDIVKMLDAFKAQSQQSSEPDPALDAAEGVRSAGMRLPEAPSKAEGYEDAWDQF